MATGATRFAIYARLAEMLAPPDWDRPAKVEGVDWQRLIDASMHHYVSPALGWRLRDDSRVPEEAAEVLEAFLYLNRDRNAQLRQGLLTVGRALNGIGLTPLLLKGSGLLLGEIYPDSGVRFLGDLDLLLPDDRLVEARDLLAALGYQPAFEGDLPEKHQLPILIHEASGVGVELHRQPINRALAALASENGMVAGSSVIEVEGAGFRLPSATDRVALAIAHGQVKDGGHARGIPMQRTLLDVAWQQHRFGDAIDWHDIRARFEAAGEAKALNATLAVTERLMGMPSPLPLPAESYRSLDRLQRILDRSSPHRLWLAVRGLAGAVPRSLGKPVSEQLAALSLSRWRARIARFYPRW